MNFIQEKKEMSSAKFRSFRSNLNVLKGHMDSYTMEPL